MIVTSWLSAFVLTQVVEAPLYMHFGKLRWAALLPSALTHPIVWFGFFHPALPLSYWPRFIGAELFAWLAEAALLHFGFKIDRVRALLISLVANSASIGIGELSRTLFQWP